MKPIEKLTLTEIAAEIVERLCAFDPTGGAERKGAAVRVWQDRVYVSPVRGKIAEVMLARCYAEKYLTVLRRGFRVGPALQQDQAVYRVEYGRMKEAPGYVSMDGARNPEAFHQTWHATRLEAAQEYADATAKRLREAQEDHAAAVALLEQEQAQVSS